MTLPFLHPAVFWTGAALMAVPILIHLLNRRRFRLLDWAAMRFLWESLRRNRRRLRIEELVLLLLRCLALLVLGAALARFVGCAAMSVLPGGAQSRAVVFILDDSYSMGQRLGGGSIFSAAVADLIDQIRSLKKLSQGDQLAIILGCDDHAGEPFFKLTHVANVEFEPLAGRISGLKPSDRRMRLGDALAAAARTLRDDKSTSRRLIVYSDFRQVDLGPGDQAEGIRKQFAELRKLPVGKVDLVAVDFGRPARTNLTLERLELLDKFAVARVPARVLLEVRNHGQAPVKDVEVRLAAKVPTPAGLRDVEMPSRVIGLIDPRSTGRAEVHFTPPQSGPVLLTAHLPADELPGDDVAWLALEARQAVSVLAVDGRPDLTDPAESESFFFVLALDPRRDGSYGTRVEVVGPEALGGAHLDDYDLVALLNVGDLAPTLDANGQPGYPQLAALQEYVRSGGGLAIFTGDRVNPAFYNGPLHADGAGLSPFHVGPPRGDPRRRDRFFRLDPRSLAADPVLRVLRDYLAAGTDPTQFVRFHAFTGTSSLVTLSAVPDVKPPRVLARFADPDNSPAIVARQFGKGTVLMIYTTASMAWNDWPADENGTYVAVLNDMLAYLAKARGGALSARVGEPIAQELGGKLRDASAALKTPRHPQQPIIPLTCAQEKDPSTGQVRHMVRYERASDAGAYILELSLPDGATRQTIFARTPDPAEGDLTPGGHTALAAALGSEDFSYLDRSTAEAAGSVRADATREYWTWALAVLLLILAAESFLGQRFGHYEPR